MAYWKEKNLTWETKCVNPNKLQKCNASYIFEKKNLPLELSLISSKTFSSSSKSFCSFGIFSSNLGIRFVESSHSFSKSIAFDESWNRKSKGKNMCSVHLNNFLSPFPVFSHLFQFILKFLDLLLHVLQIFPIFDILAFKLLKLFLTTSELIIKFLTIQNISHIRNY